jgi:hypothetical protein
MIDLEVRKRKGRDVADNASDAETLIAFPVKMPRHVSPRL